MNAFEIKRWIDTLEGGWHPLQLNDESIEALKRLFKVTEKIAPVGGDDKKEFWLSVNRGTFEEFKEYHDADSDEEELKEAFDYYFPGEICWYKFVSVHHNITGKEFYGVFLGGKYVLAVNDCNASNYPIDATPFISWLIDEAEKVVAEAIAGTYNKRINDELPYKYREGTILRKDYWDIYPKFREEYRSYFSEEEIEQFLELAESFDDEDLNSDELIQNMTARLYYEACGIGYKALGFDPRTCRKYEESNKERERYGGTTPKEYYYMYADGRDDGLSKVSMDDPEAFSEWLNQKGPYYEFNGHHPWELIPSISISNSLHMSVKKGENGYCFVLNGSGLNRSVDTIRFYLAVKKAGFPIYIGDAEILKARFLETDEIGILPSGVFSPYITHINGKKVADTINLDGSAIDLFVVAKAKWAMETVLELV